MAAILGDDWRRFIPTHGIGEQDVNAFVAADTTAHRFKSIAYGKVQLAVGKADWAMPIPLVRENGRWRFDTRAGAEEMRVRRIGRNELFTIQAVLAYCDAQYEYALADRNGDGILSYAGKLVSSPGQKDGLYWPALGGGEESPLGPLFGDDEPGEDYHGYYYRILTGQGPDAPGGLYSYRINGQLRAGFALVAWPAVYGDTGVMTFIVSHAGRVYQKDVGPDTDPVARAMRTFDPDSTWQEVQP